MARKGRGLQVQKRSALQAANWVQFGRSEDFDRAGGDEDRGL